MSKSPIKILLVEDSAVALTILKRIFNSSPELALVGTASNGKEALEMISKVKPNVICTDLHMAKMDGLELTREVMAKFPLPILVITNAVRGKNDQTTFDLLQAGAIDVFPKPAVGLTSEYEKIKTTLIEKIKVVAGVSVFTKKFRQRSLNVQKKSVNGNVLGFSSQKTLLRDVKTPDLIIENIKFKHRKVLSSLKFITIGVSTGGPRALHQILSQLPADFPVPIICTLHISNGFLTSLVDWLNQQCKLKIEIAKTGDRPLSGTVYFAPDNYHLEITPQGTFVLSESPSVDGHRPSVNVMFKSIAQFHGSKTIAIILTGMGKDGAEGIKLIHDAQGITIAQDEESSVIFGMPKEAISLGAINHILPLSKIAPFLVNLINNKNV